MAAWDRQTAWRQGHALTNDAAIELEVISPKQAASQIAVIISHDCDLVQPCETEPQVEVICGTRVEALNGNYTHAKNPRRIHIEFEEDGATIFLELLATEKKSLPKASLSKHLPNDRIKLAPKNRIVVQRWLAARYYRSAFPEEFGRRLKEARLDEGIKRIIEPLGPHLISVYFDIDDGKELDHSSVDGPYALRIYLMYDTSRDPNAALDAVEHGCHAIRGAFHKACFASGKGWESIELLDCEPISAEGMSVAMSMQLKKWNADYMSFRSGTRNDPILSE